MTTVPVGLKDEHDKASAACIAAATKVNDLYTQKNAAEQQLSAQLEKYEEACKGVALGEKGANPAAALAEADRLRHTLRGLQSLITAAEAEHAPLDRKARELAEQWTRYEEAQQIDALIAKQINLTRAAEDAERKLQEARAEMFTATNELSALRVRIERRRKAAA